MTPEQYFQRHPRLYWLALAGPVLTAGYSLIQMRSTSDGRQALRYAALAAVSVVQAVGLLRIRRPACSRERARDRLLRVRGSLLVLAGGRRRSESP